MEKYFVRSSFWCFKLYKINHEQQNLRKKYQFVLRPKYLRSDEDFETIAISNFNGQWKQVVYIEPIQPITNKKTKK